MAEERPLRAKCPHCVAGCDRCDDGYVRASVAPGPWKYRVCLGCGRANEGRAVSFGIPEPEPCVFCDGKTEWRDG